MNGKISRLLTLLYMYDDTNKGNKTEIHIEKYLEIKPQFVQRKTFFICDKILVCFFRICWKNFE